MFDIDEMEAEDQRQEFVFGVEERTLIDGRLPGDPVDDDVVWREVNE